MIPRRILKDELKLGVHKGHLIQTAMDLGLIKKNR
jgi:hypothetical protein